MSQYIEIKHNKILEENNKEKEKYLQIIEEKDKIIKEKDSKIKNIKEIKYDEAKKVGTIYLLSTDKENIIKCGRTKKAIDSRVKSIQTGLVEDIKVLYEYKTCDDVLLESIVHNILGRYRLNSNREHFSCNIEYMKVIIEIIGKTLDILKSTYEDISRDEILYKINKNLFINQENSIIQDENIININQENIININQDSIIQDDNIININQENIIQDENIININQDKTEYYFGKLKILKNSEEKKQDIFESLKNQNKSSKNEININQKNTNDNSNIININQENTNDNSNIINHVSKKKIERVCGLCNLKVFGFLYHLTRHQTSNRCLKNEIKIKNIIS